ncbi:TRAP transporter small permease [Dongia sedimenti]|uniref:TRAP transporter small permease protein n=1 Tax=Dongia sedimenti TaxID=3064282 RepID=A0ABU0YNV7_9PROT|nr:TRAP transporter small permease [Rhodospirillaceae bacterium R-7]
MVGFVRALDRCIDVILVASMAIVIAAMAAQVTLRYFFHSPLPWPEELSQFLLVGMSFLGMYVGIRRNQHIRIEWLPKNGSRFIRGLKLVGLLSICVFLAYIGYGGFKLAMTAWGQPSTALRIPMAIPYLTIPVACFLSFFAVIALMRRTWRGEAGDPR